MSMAATPTQGSEAFSAFVNSIPGLSRRLERLREFPDDDTRGEREIIWTTLLDFVQSSLTAEVQSGTETWISELAGFNYYGKDGVDDAEFITKLLLDHAIERPWIIEAPFMNNVVDILEKRENKPPNFYTSGLCTAHHDCHALNSLVQRHGRVPTDPKGSTAKALVWATIPQVSQNPQGEQLVFDVDSYLGIAGIIPLKVRESRRAIPHERQVIDSNNAILKHTFLREFRDHVKFDDPQGDASRCRARLTFQSQSNPLYRYQTSETIWQNDGQGRRMLNRITAMIRQLECVLIRCQEDGKCLLGIPFLKRGRSTSQQLDDEVLSLEMLSITDVKRFFLSFRKLEDAWSTHIIRKPGNAQILAALGSGVLGLSLAPFTAGVSLAMVPALAYGAYQASSSHLQNEAIKALSSSLTAVFRATGLEFTGLGFTSFGKSESMLHILHYSSLAVQCMSLAVQSSVRGLGSPMEFSFLENGVAEFILEGTNMGRKIFATMQPLTCLDGMLGQSVLVFGASPHNPAARMDLVASLQDMLSVWGQGELGLIRRDDNPQSYGIAEVYIGGGRLRPHGDFQSLPPRWHWESVDAYGDIVPVEYQSDGRLIDLDTRIRIGALDANLPIQVSVETDTLVKDLAEYPGSFPPIGPCQENRNCTHANETCDTERRVLMSTNRHLQELGTHRSYSQFAGYDIGAQAGQYVVGQVMWRQDRKRATVMKDTLLDETQSPVELLKKLDKTCGLLVSSCTRVMSRARLRDLVAFAGPLLHPDSFPCIIVQALQGNDRFLTWASSQMDDSGKVLRDSDKFKALILGVLQTLSCTGIRPTKDFEVAWISPCESTKAIRTPCGGNQWLYLFKDGPNTATFACITPLCLETQSQKCAGLQGGPPQCSFSNGLGNFALSTRVLLLLGEHAGQGQANPQANLTLEVGRRYFLDSTTLRIVAKVCEESESAYIVKIKESKIMMGVLHRLVERGDSRFIRESNDDLAIPCLISGAE